MDFFEVINRPVEAVKSAIAAGIDGESVLEASWKGLSGQEVTSGKEILKDLTGIDPQTGVGKFVADIGVDILLDPLTYLPAGFFIKGLKKLSGVGSRTVTKVGQEIVSTSAQKAGKILTDSKLAGEVGAAAKTLIKSGDEIKALKQGTQDLLATSGQKNLAKGVQAEIDSIKNYQEHINDYLTKNGLTNLKEDFAIIGEGTTRKIGGRNTKDLSVYMRTIDDAGAENWVKINSIEVKDLASKGFGVTSAVDISDFGKVDGVVGKQAKSSKKFIQKLEKADPKTAAKLKEFLEQGKKGSLYDKTIFGDGVESIQKALTDVFYDDLIADGVTHLSLKLKNGKLVSMSVDNARRYLKMVTGTIMENTGKGISKTVLDRIKTTFGKFNFFTAADTPGLLGKNAKIISKTGLGKTLKIDENIIIAAREMSKDDLLKQVGKTITDAKETTKITAVAEIDDGLGGIDYVLRTSNVTSGAKPRLSSSLNLVDADGKKLADEFIETLDETENLTQSLLQQAKPAEVITETISLAGRARAGEFGTLLQRISRAYKNFEVNFKLTFGLYAGLSPEAASLLKKAYGENLFELERRSARLFELKKKLIAVDPEAGELLGEIIEASARVENGKIIKLARRQGKSDFLDYAIKRMDDGMEIVLPSFADDMARKNFLDDLNDLYRRSNSMQNTADELFDVAVGANGGTVLKIKGDASELRDVIKYYNDQKLLRPAVNAGDYVYFGEKALSSKAQKLLMSNADLVQDYQNLSNEILTELVDVAGFDNLPRELSGQIGYMRHIMSQEAFAQLQRTYKLTNSTFARKGKDVLTKRTFMGSAQEVNAALRDFAGLSTDLFDPNAFNAMEDLIKVAQRKLDQHRVLEIILKETGKEGDQLFKVVDNIQEAAKDISPYDRAFKDFRDEFNALYENLSPKSQEMLDNYFKAQGYGPDKAIVMNKSAFNVLKGAQKAYVDIPPLIKTYDKFLNTWKGLTLVSPGFHLRNMFGNMFNSYAAGMDTIAQGKYLTKAVTEMDTYQRVGKKLAQGLDITKEEQEIFDLVKGYFENGVSQTHRGIRDLETVKDASAQTIKGSKLKNGYNTVVRFNFNVAEKMDDIQRYALYRWGLDTTGDATQAAKKVAEALFDYSALTPFEKDYMKRIFPFYTFMKNNFVFQAKNIFANPKQYARVGRAYKYGAEDLAGYGVDNMPDYAQENMWLPIPMTVNKNDKAAIAFLKANLPIGDFTELVENPFKKGVVSVTAPLKLLIEFGAGRDMFTGAPLQNFPGERRGLEPGTGVLAGLRDPKGNLTISQSPLFQKILGDIGLRTPMNFASTGLDLVDTLAGYQGGAEGLGDFMARMGIVGIQETDNLELTKLYQDLEKLRELKKYYEQETGNQLPVLPR